VSGPGATSQRTDGKEPIQVAPGGDYGDRQDLENLQAAAPIQAADAGTGSGTSLEDLLKSVTPLDADTQQPGTPVTDGAATGEGRGLEALGVPSNDTESTIQSAQALPKSVVRLMIQQSQRPEATTDFKRAVSLIVAARGGSA
jgi:hypothetical protein